MLVGFHVEGWDFLIFKTYLAQLLEIPETEIEEDWIDQQGRGVGFVYDQVPRALHRFYGKCAQFAVVAVDNDGDQNLAATGKSEDPAHPRHWLHAETVDACRWCRLHEQVEETRTQLNWLPQKPGAQWPILIVVPVEIIESWLLISESILRPGHGSMYAENERRAAQKQKFYGTPFPSREDVVDKALPLIRQMNKRNLSTLIVHSKSFAQFAEQVEDFREVIRGPRDCWQEGDRGGDR